MKICAFPKCEIQYIEKLGQTTSYTYLKKDTKQEPWDIQLKKYTPLSERTPASVVVAMKSNAWIFQSYANL